VAIGRVVGRSRHRLTTATRFVPDDSGEEISKRRQAPVDLFE
jgi:hypothetical protein